MHCRDDDGCSRFLGKIYAIKLLLSMVTLVPVSPKDVQRSGFLRCVLILCHTARAPFVLLLSGFTFKNLLCLAPLFFSSAFGFPSKPFPPPCCATFGGIRRILLAPLISGRCEHATGLGITSLSQSSFNQLDVSEKDAVLFWLCSDMLAFFLFQIVQALNEFRLQET